MWRQIKRTLVGAIILGLAGMVGYLWWFGPRGGVIRTRLDPPAIVQEIQALKELVTVRFGVQKIIGLQEERIPFGSESVVLMVRAEVLGGVDLGELRPSAVQVTGPGQVTIRLPAPKVMHVFVDDRATKVWDRTKTWWPPWVPLDRDLDQKARLMALESAQAAALEMGLLTRAQQNAEQTIRDFLKALGGPSVTFVPAAPAPAP